MNGAACYDVTPRSCRHTTTNVTSNRTKMLLKKGEKKKLNALNTLQSKTQTLVLFKNIFQSIKYISCLSFFQASASCYNPPSNLRATATPRHSGIKAHWAFRGERPSRWCAPWCEGQKKSIHVLLWPQTSTDSSAKTSDTVSQHRQW